jgi:hypothetical protein
LNGRDNRDGRELLPSAAYRGRQEAHRGGITGFVAEVNGLAALAVGDLGRTDVIYDDKTLRMMPYAAATVNVAVSSLSM